MSNYSCPRCGYDTNISQCYINHIRRKKICESTVSHCTLENEYDKHILLRKKITKEKKQTKIKKEKNTFNCEYCDKSLSSKQMCDNHMKKCKDKIQIDKPNKLNDKKSEEIDNKQLLEIMTAKMEELQKHNSNIFI